MDQWLTERQVKVHHLLQQPSHWFLFLTCIFFIFSQKVSASDFSGKPIASKAVYLLDGSQWPTKLLLNLTTNQNGLADFTLNTADLPKADLSLVVSWYFFYSFILNEDLSQEPIPFIVPQASATPEVVYGYRSPYFNSETRTVKLLQPASPYSPTFSELTIVKLEQPLKCGANYPVTIKYSFVGETGDYNTDIIYMVSGHWFCSDLCLLIAMLVYLSDTLCTLPILSGLVQRSYCPSWIS